MKTTTLLMTLILVLPLHADQDKKTPESYAKRDAELRVEIEAIEKEMLKLSRHLTTLKRKLDGLPPVSGVTEELVIDVLPSGEVSVDDDKFTKAVLMKKLKAITAVKAEFSVRLRANPKVTYQQVVDIIDICQEAGIRNISFATSKKK